MKRAQEITTGATPTLNGWIIVILLIVGLGIVGYGYMQAELNKAWRALPALRSSPALAAADRAACGGARRARRARAAERRVAPPIATEVQINGGPGSAKIRHPVAVCVLSVVTIGIYYLYWWYQVNREMVDLGRALNADGLGDNPALAARNGPGRPGDRPAALLALQRRAADQARAGACARVPAGTDDQWVDRRSA